jgi:flavin-dependent dehydrogenase
MAVKQCLIEDGSARGVEALSLADGKMVRYHAPLIVDASGRNSRLMVNREERRAGLRGSRLYGLKAHLANVEGIAEQVELYFFPQGYGGLSLVEDNLVNLCFIAGEQTFRAAGGDPAKIVEQTVMRNALARERLRGAEVVGKWHSVGPLAFGHRRLSQSGVLAIGDASGMIDPFTGTGIQIALRTGEMAAQAIIDAMSESATTQRAGLFDRALSHYAEAYTREFGNRMKVAGWLRRVALSPAIAGPVASLLALSPSLTRRILRATRSSGVTKISNSEA